jgi:hypothetical protein
MIPEGRTPVSAPLPMAAPLAFALGAGILTYVP